MKKFILAFIISLIFAFAAKANCMADAAMPEPEPVPAYYVGEDMSEGIPYGAVVTVYFTMLWRDEVYIGYEDESGEEIYLSTSASNITPIDYEINHSEMNMISEECFTYDVTPVFSGPSLIFDVIYEIPADTKLTLKGYSGDYFAYIEYEGRGGFILRSVSESPDGINTTIMYPADKEEYVFKDNVSLYNSDESETGLFMKPGEKYHILGRSRRSTHSTFDKVEYDGNVYYMWENYPAPDYDIDASLYVTNPKAMTIYSDYALKNQVSLNIPIGTVLDIKVLYLEDNHFDCGYALFEYDGNEYFTYTLDSYYLLDGYYEKQDYGTIQISSYQDNSVTAVAAEDISCYVGIDLTGDENVLLKDTEVSVYVFAPSDNQEFCYIVGYGWADVQITEGMIKQVKRENVITDTTPETVTVSEMKEDKPMVQTEKAPDTDIETKSSEEKSFLSSVKSNLIIAVIFVLVAVGAGIAGIVLLKKKK